MQTIKLEFKIDRKTWLELGPEKERHLLSKKIDEILQRSQLGSWSGSATRGNSLVIYCMVNDPVLAKDTIKKGLADHKLISYLT